MPAITSDNLGQFVRFLGHNLFCVKSVRTGEKGAQEAYFNMPGKRAVDYINNRNGKRQLWINLQRFKARPEKEDGSKKYHSYDDINHYANILLDIDAEKELEDYAATEEERQKALGQLPTVQAWLEDHGFSCGVMAKTGNGGGFILPIPPTPSEPVFIAKVAAFLKLVKTETGCNIDTTVFDPARVVGIIGTVNAKLETEDRKNQVRKAIEGIPDRFEDEKLLEFTQGLEPDPDALKEWDRKFGEEPHKSNKSNNFGANKEIEDSGLEHVAEKLRLVREGNPTLNHQLNWTDEAKERYGGDRSDCEFGIAVALLENGFSDIEIDYVMRNVSKTGKWAEDGDHYRDLTLRKAKSKHQDNLAEKTSKKLPSLDDARQKWESLKDSTDLRTWLDPEPVAILATIKRHDLTEYEICLEESGLSHKIKKTLRDKVETILETIREAEERKVEIPGSEVSEKTRTKAIEVLNGGDPLGYVMKTFGDLYVGNENAGKLVYCCQLSPHIKNSKGLHPKLTGESGKGKSALIETVIHTLPEEWYIKASLTSRALFYNSIQPGTLIFCDDYRQNEDIDTVIKQSTSRFHKPYSLLTVDRANGGLKGREVAIPEELVWAITSVDSDQGTQVLNRAVPLDVDDSYETDLKVAEHILKQAKEGIDDLPETEEVRVCREMFRILKSESFGVKVPFADRIEWRDPGNRRNLPMFLDILRSLTFWRRFQRVTDKGGYLLATEEDFEEAKILYCGERRSDSFKSKLTAKQMKLARLIVQNSGQLTRQEAAEMLNVSPNRIDQLVHGKGKVGEKKGGLVSKLPGFQVEKVSETIRIEDGHSKTIHQTIFKLKFFDLWGEIENVVDLKPFPVIEGTQRNPKGTPKEPPTEPPIISNSSNNKGGKGTFCGRDIGEEFSSITEFGDCGENFSLSQSGKRGSGVPRSRLLPVHNGTPGVPRGSEGSSISPDGESRGSSIKGKLADAELNRKEKADHFSHKAESTPGVPRGSEGSSISPDSESGGSSIRDELANAEVKRKENAGHFSHKAESTPGVPRGSGGSSISPDGENGGSSIKGELANAEMKRKEKADHFSHKAESTLGVPRGSEGSSISPDSENGGSSIGERPTQTVDPKLDDLLNGYAHKPKPVVPFVIATNNGGGFSPGQILQAVKAKGWEKRQVKVDGGQKMDGWLPSEAWELLEGGGGEDARVEVP